MSLVPHDELTEARLARDLARRERMITDAALGLHASGTTVIELAALTGKLRADMRRAERCLIGRVRVMERTLGRTERKVTLIFAAISATSVALGGVIARWLV